MQAYMVIRVPELTGYGSVRHVAVSLPRVPELIDGKKYMHPGDVKQFQAGTELRRQRAPRAPSMRSLVRLALKCDSAEQMGKALKRRFERQQRREGLRPRQDDREIDERLRALHG
jgi:hypothetical protein